MANSITSLPSAWEIFWLQVEQTVTKIVMANDEAALKADWAHVFAQCDSITHEPIRQFHLPKDTPFVLNKADFVAVTNISKNPQNSQQWLTVLGQDGAGLRHAKFYKLRRIGDEYYAHGPQEIEVGTAHFINSQNIDHAAQVLDRILSLIGTAGKEAQDGLH